jgi:cytochrome c-type biogenesis protein CcmH/NrfF
MQWWQEHLANMMTSGIAALTAFLLVNMRPNLVVWLAPAVVGGAGILLWQRYYRRKFAEEAGSGSGP